MLWDLTQGMHGGRWREDAHRGTMSFSQPCRGCSRELDAHLAGKALPAVLQTAQPLSADPCKTSATTLSPHMLQERMQITPFPCCFSSLENRPLSHDSLEHYVLLHNNITAFKTFKGLQLARSLMYLALLLMLYGYDIKITFPTCRFTVSARSSLSSQSRLEQDFYCCCTAGGDSMGRLRESPCCSSSVRDPSAPAPGSPEGRSGIQRQVRFTQKPVQVDGHGEPGVQGAPAPGQSQRRHRQSDTTCSITLGVAS